MIKLIVANTMQPNRRARRYHEIECGSSRPPISEWSGQSPWRNPLLAHERHSHELIRLLQVIALYVPGATTTRVWLHRKRGVTIGQRVFIGTDAILETARPELISI